MSNLLKRSGITEANGNQQRKKKRKLADPVRLHAQTIAFGLENGDVRVVARDFQVQELSQRSDAETTNDNGLLVEFNTATPKQMVIAHLCSIIAKIKAMELPDPDSILERRTAALVMRVQKKVERLSRHVEKLPPALRARVLRMVKTPNDERTQDGTTVN
jgi:hypothetical protein